MLTGRTTNYKSLTRHPLLLQASARNSKRSSRMVLLFLPKCIPGVAESIDSDLNTLKRFLVFGNVIPKGLFIEDLIRGIRDEVKNE